MSLAIAGALVACGGGGGSNGGNTPPPTQGAPTPSPTPTPTPTACSVADRQAWVLDQLQQFYLFPDLLDTSVNPSNYSDVQSYIDALVAPARATGRDRFFTYITSIEEENELINSGSSAGFGFRLGYDTVNGRVFVLESFENAPAYPRGFDRGTEILSVGGTSTADLLANGGPANFSAALGPSDPGVTRSFTIRQPDNTQSSVSVSKAEYALDPISDRYGAQVIDNNGTQVGYINLRTFIIQNAGDQLRDAIGEFRQQGITEVILDFRYNGGGLVSVGELLGDLLGADKVGQEFSSTIFRASLASNNTTELFETQPEAIAATKIALIGTGSTASASELVGNAFIPYLGNNTALVGSNTFGKPSGQIARDRPTCDDRLRVLAFRVVNSNDQGDYYNGLAEVYQRTCAAPDDFLSQLGSTSEDSTATALTFLRGGTCNPITASGNQRAQSGPNIRTLQAPLVRRSAAQHQVPGLF
ncbi:S41 family peptidase [Alteriqipengyuania lutimaris]|uniref:S41 family peptidase n=1 Tax=Alteriqipengyuania lutimaris TaxID=1538146 RepID=UPI0017E9338F|nr:S41 family peptidase [Alteriqipengyuania lutimaris]MBB3034968.1 C-terminal processing protease CtpA/Prc [Alteriqipengyuania lutimaris]